MATPATKRHLGPPHLTRDIYVAVLLGDARAKRENDRRVDEGSGERTMSRVM
jgi:hypothetical protein